MADVQQAIRTLKIEATQTGIDQVTGKVRDLSKAQDDLTVASDSTSKASLSLEGTFDKLERRYVTTVKAQQDYAKVQQQVNAAVAQNPALAERGNAVLDAAAVKYGQAGNAAKIFAAATSGVSSQLVALSAGAGPLGTALAAFGPAGLAVAAGIGAATTALHAMTEEATRLGTLADSLKNTAETAGITATQLQVLQTAGAEVGLSAEKVATGIERFTVGVEELRRGGGPLYDELMRVNGALVSQISTTKSTAEAWDLVSKAYVQADDRQRTLIARAVGGGRNLDFGRLIGATGDAGGLSDLQAGLDQVDLITEKQVKHWADLKSQIELTASVARNNIASIYTDSVLEREKRLTDQFLEFSRAAKEFSLSGDLTKLINSNYGQMFLQGLTSENGMSGYVPTVPAPTADDAKQRALDVAKYRIGQGLSQGQNADRQLLTSYDPASRDVQFDAKTTIAQVNALGSAATAYERLQARIAALNVEQAKTPGIITDEIKQRAIAAASLEMQIQLESGRISLLGPMVSISEQVAQKELEIAAARQKGVNISKDEAAAIIDLTRQRALGIDQIRASADAYTLETQIVGMSVGQAAAFTAVQNRLNEARRNGQVLTNGDITSIKNEATALGVAAQRADDLRFEYETFSGTFREFGQNIRNGQSAMQAFGNAGVSALGKIADRLMDMASRQLWNAAFPSGGGGIFSLLGIGGGTSSATGSIGPPAPVVGGAGPGFVVPTFRDGGMVGLNGGPSVYVHPAYFENAPRFDVGGKITDDGVPIIAHPGERILNRQQTADYDRGGKTSPSITIMNTNDFRGVDPSMRAFLMAQINASSAKTRQDLMAEVSNLSKNAPGYIRKA